MKKELIELQPVLKVAQKDTDELMAQLSQLPGVQQKQREVGADADVVERATLSLRTRPASRLISRKQFQPWKMPSRL